MATQMLQWILSFTGFNFVDIFVEFFATAIAL